MGLLASTSASPLPSPGGRAPRETELGVGGCCWPLAQGCLLLSASWDAGLKGRGTAVLETCAQ